MTNSKRIEAIAAVIRNWTHREIYWAEKIIEADPLTKQYAKLEKRCAELERIIAECAVVIMAINPLPHCLEMQQQIERVKPIIHKALQGGDDAKE